MTALLILTVIPVVVAQVLGACAIGGLLVLPLYWKVTDARQEPERQVKRMARQAQRMSTNRCGRLFGWLVPDGARMPTPRERRLLRLCQQGVRFSEQLLADNKRLLEENTNLRVERSATDALLGKAMDVLKGEQPGGQA